MRPRLRLVHPVLACALGLAQSACAQREAAPSDSAQNAQADPSGIGKHAGDRLRDPAYAFELRAPDGDWELLGPEGAKQLNPLGRAAALDGRGGTVIVLTERALSEDFEQMVALFDPALPAGVERERLRFQGFEALRVRYHQSFPGTGGAQTSVVHTLFLREGYMFQLISGAPGDPSGARGLALQDSFTALDTDTPGAVRGEQELHAPVEHAQGLTWRVREGVHESVASGWRYRLPNELQANYTVGEALAKLGDFELFVSTPQHVYLSVQTEPVAPERAEALLAEERAQKIERAGPVQGSWSRELAGEALSFELQHHQGMAIFSAAQIREGRLRKLTLWHPRALGEAGERQREALLAGLEAIPAAELAELRAELLEQQRAQQYCPGVERSAHGGTVHHFGAALTWTAPRGFWDLCSEQPASGEQPFVFGVSELELGLRASLRRQPLPQLEGPVALRAALLDELVEGRELVDEGQHQLGALRFEWVMLAGGPEQTLDYYAYARAGEQLWVWTQVAPRDSPAARERMRETLAQLRFEDELPPVYIEGDRLIDRRYGVSVGVPKGAALEIGTAPPEPLSWTRDGATWSLGVMALPAGADEDWGRRWVADLFDQHLRAQPLTLLGRAAQHLRGSEGLSADVVSARGHAFVLIYEGVSEDEIAQTRASLRLP